MTRPSSVPRPDSGSPSTSTGVAVTELARGDVLASPQADLRPAYLIDARASSSTPSEPEHGDRVQVHHGTRESPARLAWLGGALLAGPARAATDRGARRPARHPADRAAGHARRRRRARSRAAQARGRPRAARAAASGSRAARSRRRRPSAAPAAGAAAAATRRQCCPAASARRVGARARAAPARGRASSRRWTPNSTRTTSARCGRRGARCACRGRCTTTPMCWPTFSGG